MVPRVRLVLLAAVATLAIAATARAQDDNRIAVGISYTGRVAEAPSTRASRGIGFAWRLGHSDTGWGVATGLGWFAADINRPIGGLTTEIGELHVRPFMAGYGYTRSFGRYAVSADLLGGFAFVSFQQAPNVGDVARDRLGARSVELRASNALVLRPQTNVWFDVSRKIGVNVSVGYAITRPRLTMRSSLGEESHRLRADTLIMSAGIVYKIF
jgi:hypothetical protein